MKVIAGLDTEFEGRAQVHEGVKVGYLSQVNTTSSRIYIEGSLMHHGLGIQEPELDPTKDVRGNVLAGVQDKLDILEEYNQVRMAVKYVKDSVMLTDGGQRQICKRLEEGESDNKELSARKEQLDALVEKLGIKDLDWRIDLAMHALRCPEPTKQVHFLSGVRTFYRMSHLPYAPS